jgi:predicted transcriptional regulator
MAPSRTSRVRLDADANRAAACQLRRAGLTQQAIADELGVSKRQVGRYLLDTRATLHKLASDELEAWRSATLHELAEIREELWSDLRGSDRSLAIRAARALLSASQREAQLLGLDAPTRIDAAVSVPMTPAEAEDMLRKFGDIP